MNNLAIIGASYLQLPLIERAKELGYTTHVFAWKANDVGEDAADYFYPISIIEKERILKKCREIGVCGICSIASDIAMVTVGYVASKLGLCANSMQTVERSTNKHLMRLAFEQNGVPSPKSYLVDANTAIDTFDLSYPIIVKPTDRSGSRGIFKLENKSGLRNAIKKATDESFAKQALIEEFAEGEEFSVEYISYQGKHRFLALTKKFTTGAPHFIETAHVEPADVNTATLSAIQTVTEQALDALGITCGASHTELKIADDGSIKVIEVGGRMGGDCIGSDLVKLSTGYDFVKMVIDTACGKAPDFTKICKPSAVKSVFIMTKADYNEYLLLKKEHPERIVRTAFINTDALDFYTDSSNRAGCYIIKL